MGVRGLYPYIRDSDSTPPYKWHRVVNISTYQTVVIDTYNWVQSIYNARYWDTNYGGDYITLSNFLRKFIDNLRDFGLEPVFVTDGVLQLEKLAENLSRKTAKQRQVYNNYENRKIPYNASNCLQFDACMFKVLEEKGVEHLKALAEGDAYTAMVANQRNALLITRDNDYYIFPYSGKTAFLNFDDLGTRMNDNRRYQDTRLAHKQATNSTSINQFVPVFDQQMFCDYHKCTVQDLIRIPLTCGNDFTERTPTRWNEWSIICALKNTDLEEIYSRNNKSEKYETVVKFYSLDPSFCRGMGTKFVRDRFDYPENPDISDLHWKMYYSNRIDAYDMSVLITGRRLDSYLLDDRNKEPAWSTAEPILAKISTILQIPNSEQILHFKRRSFSSEWWCCRQTSSKLSSIHPSFTISKKVTLDNITKQDNKFNLLKQVFNHPPSITSLQEAHLLAITVAEFMSLSNVEFDVKEAIIDAVLLQYSIFKCSESEERFLRFFERQNKILKNKQQSDPIYDSRENLSGLADWNVVYSAVYRLGMILGTTWDFGLDPGRYWQGSAMKYLLNERLNSKDARCYIRQMGNALLGMENDKVFETFEQVKWTANEFYEHWCDSESGLGIDTDNEIQDMIDSKLTYVEILQKTDEIPKIRPKTRRRTSSSVSSVTSNSSATWVHSKLRQKTRTSCNTITEKLSNFHFPR